MVQTIVGGLNGSDQTIVGGLNGSDYSWRPKWFRPDYSWKPKWFRPDYSWRPKWFRPDYSWRPKSTEVMVKNLLLLVEASLYFLYVEKWFRNEMESSINGGIDYILARILNDQLLNRSMTVLNGNFFLSTTE